MAITAPCRNCWVSYFPGSSLHSRISIPDLCALRQRGLAGQVVEFLLDGLLRFGQWAGSVDQGFDDRQFLGEASDDKAAGRVPG